MSLAPASFQALLAGFALLFHPATFENFVTLTLGWILARGSHTISRAIQAHGVDALDKHHSAIYAFFSRASWAPDALGEELFRLLIPYLPTHIELLVDDTLSKKSGPHIWGAGMHHDATSSTYGRGSAKARHVAFAFGINFVILALWIPLPWNPRRGVAIPVLFRLYRSLKTCRPKNEYRKRTELAHELVHLFVEWNDYHETGRRILLMGDSEYACKTVLRDRPEGVDFIGPLPMDAALYERPPKRKAGQKGRPRKKGARLPNPKQVAGGPDIPWQEAELPLYGKEVRLLVKTFVCLWYTVTKTQLVRVVITRDPSGRLDDRAYFSTDPRMAVREVLIRYSHRWPLEVTFHDAKQYLGLADPQNGWWRRPHGSPRPEKKPGPDAKGNRGRKASERTTPFIFLTYGFVYLWYFEHGSPRSDVASARARAPWYGHKAEPSFPDMLASVRWEILATKISADPELVRVRGKLEGLFGEQVRGT